ncbi:MAG TPA: hypothetical protein VGL77_21305 [Armatimonadota bacterium]|jgi:hypothetical protein
MNIASRWLVLHLLCLALCLPVVAAWNGQPSTQKEKVRTSEGVFLLFYRIPAQPADLAMPLYSKGTVEETFVYRVLDRKQRDLLFFARVRITSPQPAATVRQFYQDALGKDCAQSTDAKTGEMTLTVGTKELFRLVVISPKDTGCAIRLERMHTYNIPARVYTDSEQRVISLLQAVGAAYGQAGRVRYTLQQQAIVPGATPGQQPHQLTWTVDYRRPAQLQVTAAVGDTIGLRLTTEQGTRKVVREGEVTEVASPVLRIHQQRGNDQIRPLNGKIVIDDVPELAEDPVANLMLGESFVTPLVDTLAMRAVPGSAGRQSEVTLTYPDNNETVHLIIDLQRKTIVRADTTIATEGRPSMRVVRTYANLVLDPPTIATPTAETQPESLPSLFTPLR